MFEKILDFRWVIGDNFLFRAGRQAQAFSDIGWCDHTVDRFFKQDIASLEAEVKPVIQMAQEAEKRGQLATQYVQGLRKIEQCQNQARKVAYLAYGESVRDRQQITDIKAKLLAAAAKG